MPIISVGDLWKVFEFATGDKRRKREAVVEWLDYVYSDLDHLSRLWNGVWEHVGGAEYDDACNLLGVHRPGFNIMPHSRLMEFYRGANTVLAQQHPEGFREPFIHQMANILLHRQKLIQQSNQYYTNLRMHEFSTVDAEEFMKSERAMQKEIAELQVLIRTFKTTA